MADEYKPYVTFDAHGRMVGLMTCNRCGSALLLESDGTDESVVAAHDRWHERIERAILRAKIAALRDAARAAIAAAEREPRPTRPDPGQVSP